MTWCSWMWDSDRWVLWWRWRHCNLIEIRGYQSDTIVVWRVASTTFGHIPDYLILSSSSIIVITVVILSSLLNIDQINISQWLNRLIIKLFCLFCYILLLFIFSIMSTTKPTEENIDVPKNKRYRKDKPWDDPSIDHWKVEPIQPE